MLREVLKKHINSQASVANGGYVQVGSARLNPTICLHSVMARFMLNYLHTKILKF